jgi:hypothetical protein
VINKENVAALVFTATDNFSAIPGDFVIEKTAIATLVGATNSPQLMVALNERAIELGLSINLSVEDKSEGVYLVRWQKRDA